MATSVLGLDDSRGQGQEQGQGQGQGQGFVAGGAFFFFEIRVVGLHKTLRIVNTLMIAIFAAGVAVQVNDPDPIRWMAIYLAACAAAFAWAVRAALPQAVPVGVGIIALCWAMLLIFTGPELAAYGRMFDAWEMDSAATEVAREGTGLLLIAGWMAVLAWTSSSGPRRTR